MSSQSVKVGKFLSYVLRHEPQAIGLSLDSQGWVALDALVAAARVAGWNIDEARVVSIVKNNDKKRFTLSDDGLRIRASQGHSTSSVNITREPKVPPQVLYHGTATRFLEAILREGLRPGTRHQVHLSQDITTATAVGQRHGRPVVLEVQAQLMQEQGFVFSQAENGVWLTDLVPAGFVKLLVD